VGHLPLNETPPCLLAHPAAASPAADQLKGGQVVGMVTQPHEGAGPQQIENITPQPLRGADPGPMGTRVIGG
jgi:hypothetical protein